MASDMRLYESGQFDTGIKKRNSLDGMLSPYTVDIQFKDISMEISTGIYKKHYKQILKGVSGLFKSGQLTAIMGPSGAGKSSLLNALTGFSYEGVTGRMRAGDNMWEIGNKTDSLQHLKAYRRKSCYILQDDRLNPLLTVKELMQLAADLKLEKSVTKEHKNAAITNILHTLGLSETLQTRCSNLSGGQRKRLSIAAELINNPPVIFLDEPTTGLDSLSSLQCITMLKELAGSGHTVVCTIHQPSASMYKMFNQAYILAEGMCIYNGTSEETVPYMAKFGFRCPMYHNPADYVLEVVNGEYGNFNQFLAQNCSRFNEDEQMKIKRKSSIKSISDTNMPSEFHRLGILLKRGLVQQLRDWTVTHLKIFSHLFVGILLGLVFQNVGDDASKSFNNLGYVMITLVYICYTSIMPAALKFSQELSILKKENFNNWYKLKTYYAATLILSLPFQIIFSVMYATPSYVLTGQPIELSRFLMFVLVLSCMGLLSDALGNFIGTFVNPINGTFIGAITLCALLLLGGYLVFLSHMLYTFKIIAYVSYIRLGFEAVVSTLYAYGRTAIPCPETKIYCHLRAPKEILNLLSFTSDNFWINIGVILAEICVLRTITFYCLRRKISKIS